MARTLIEPGRLKERVTVMHRIGAQDPIYGGYTYTWEPLAMIGAEVQDILASRRENIADGVSIARRPALVRTRYRDDLDSNLRLVLNGRSLNIIAVSAELGLRAGVEFMAEELITQGEEPRQVLSRWPRRKPITNRKITGDWFAVCVAPVPMPELQLGNALLFDRGVCPPCGQFHRTPT